jgi:hypothetical protein
MTLTADDALADGRILHHWNPVTAFDAAAWGDRVDALFKCISRVYSIGTATCHMLCISHLIALSLLVIAASNPPTKQRESLPPSVSGAFALYPELEH